MVAYCSAQGALVVGPASRKTHLTHHVRHAIISPPDERGKNEVMVRVDTVVDSWKTIREDSAQAVEDFSAHELDYRPSPDQMTFGGIARHILEVGHVLSAALLDEVESMAAPEFREIRQKYVAQLPQTEGAGALAREPRPEIESRAAELSTKPAEFYAGEFTRFDGQRVTRLEMLQFIKEHELTHRQQLFMYLRLKGIIPPTTRRRMAKAKTQTIASNS
jgi:uncharacterized damage-inducible protein DinB